MFEINIFLVLVAAVVAFILGFLFHGPLLGKVWMKLANVHPTGNEKFKDMIPQMLWNLFVNFVMAYALASIYLLVFHSSMISVSPVATAITCAFWLWVVQVSFSSMEVIWMGRTFKLWLFESACALVILLSMGFIIAH